MIVLERTASVELSIGSTATRSDSNPICSRTNDRTQQADSFTRTPPEERGRELYRRVYTAVCGRHPLKRFWHYSWLATKDLYSDLARILPKLEGAILDAGCGTKPYRNQATRANLYVGIDASPGARADVRTPANGTWPFADNSFDAVLCTQVLEYVDLSQTVGEICRVLKPGGTTVVTAPFLHPHEPGHDCRRFTTTGLRELFQEKFEILQVRAQGGAGSVLGLFLLGWFNSQMNFHAWTRLLKGVCFPLWIPFCLVVNGLGHFLDRIDATGTYYPNVLLIARKPCPSQPDRLGQEVSHSDELID